MKKWAMNYWLALKYSLPLDVSLDTISETILTSINA